MHGELTVESTALPGVLQINPPTVFEDHRGSYVETYNRIVYERAGIDQEFIQDDISVSSRNVLRGLHGDSTTWKLVTCLLGSFYLIVANNNPESSEYKKWVSFTLSDKNRLQVLIPPQHGNGHLVLSETAIFHYKQSTVYDRDSQFTINWQDPEFDFWWPISEPILSRRDS